MTQFLPPRKKQNAPAHALTLAQGDCPIVFVLFYSNTVKRPGIATQNDLKALYIEPRVSVMARCIFAGNRLKRQGEGAVWVSPGQFAVAHKERIFFESDSSIGFSCLA